MLCLRIIPYFCFVQTVKNAVSLLVFLEYDCVIIWIPKYFCVSEQRFSLSLDSEMMWDLLSGPLKCLGLSPSAGITYRSQPVNKAGLKHALEGWCTGQTLPLPSKQGTVRDLRTHGVWEKPNEPQGEAEDRDALKTNSASETNRNFLFGKFSVHCCSHFIVLNSLSGLLSLTWFLI